MIGLRSLKLTLSFALLLTLYLVAAPLAHAVRGGSSLATVDLCMTRDGTDPSPYPVDAHDCVVCQSLTSATTALRADNATIERYEFVAATPHWTHIAWAATHRPRSGWPQQAQGPPQS